MSTNQHIKPPLEVGLVEGSQIFRTLFDLAPDPGVVVDSEGTIVFVNVQTERVFGYERQALLGEKIEVLVPARYRGAHVGLRAGYFRHPKVRAMGSGLALYGLKRSGEEFPIEISLSPVQTEGGTLVYASIRDITEEAHRQEEVRLARAQAEAASSAKSEFLASMSHELRTPLNAILGFAQLLHRDKKTPLSARHRERIEHVLKGGEHLLRLIDDILDLSRIEAGRVLVSLEPVNVSEVLHEVQSTLAPMSARAEVTLALAPFESELPLVTADITRFKQVLMNYGSNAIKYGKARGQVIFRTELVEQWVRVSVEDDGIGIAEDQQDKIFSPFHRAGQETGPIEGTGIGLAITKRLAELMDGRVGFESEEGRGSRFWIELPIHTALADEQQARPVPSRPVASTLQGRDGPRYLIVYIEDNPSNIAFMSDLIGDYERVDLITAPTAEIGIELVRARRPNVVIMDINLPGMSGFEATERLRQWPETSAIPVIALSAAAMTRDVHRNHAAGFYRYLTKPVKVDELESVLEELLAG